MVDLLRLEAGALDGGLDDDGAEVGGGEVGVGALEPADGRAGAADDDDVFHCSGLLFGPLGRMRGGLYGVQ